GGRGGLCRSSSRAIRAAYRSMEQQAKGDPLNREETDEGERYEPDREREVRPCEGGARAHAREVTLSLISPRRDAVVSGVEEFGIPAAKERDGAEDSEGRHKPEAQAVGDAMRDRGDEEQVREELEGAVLSGGEDDRVQEPGDEGEDQD